MTKSILFMISYLVFSILGLTCNCINFESASEVLDLAMCSNHLPNEMNTNSIGGVSKKVIGDVSFVKFCHLNV